jgi:hypothetical protein
VARDSSEKRSRPVGVIVVGAVAALLLGAIGLPRLQSTFAPAESPTPVVLTVATDVPETPPSASKPAATPARQVGTSAPTAAPSPSPSGARVVFSQSLASPLPNWPNDPNGTARFADGAYRLFARDPGRFVAVGIPLPQPLADVVISGDFRKVGGPVGGGYGFIVRDQGSPRELDGQNQSGNYIALAVNDRGDVGVWQRDETRWIDLVPWTHSDAVRTGTQPNAIEVSTSGAALRFNVNGQTVAVLSNDALPVSGGVGIFVGGDMNEVALERLSIQSAG